MTKFHYLLVLLVVLAIALVSRWLLRTVEEPTGRTPPEERHDPDYFLENFKLTIYQPNGVPAYRLNGQHLNHFPDDDTMVLTKLRLEYLAEKDQSWVTTANAGTAYQNIEVIHLDGDVQIHHQDINPEHAYTINTDTLRIELPKKYASTDAVVKIVSKTSTITAKGMTVDLAAGEMTLLSEARGHYVPK